MVLDSLMNTYVVPLLKNIGVDVFYHGTSLTNTRILNNSVFNTKLR